MRFPYYLYRHAPRHSDVIDYSKVENNVKFIFPKKTAKRRPWFGRRVIYLDESGEPSITDKTVGNRFGIGAVVTRRPEKIEQLGSDYPSVIESGKHKGREYKYATLKNNPEEILYRAKELRRIPASYFGCVLIKTSNPGNIRAYEVYRTNLHRLLTDISDAYPHSYFDLYVDYTTTLTYRDLERECAYFPRITPHPPIMNSPNGGLRVADMVAGIITDEVTDNPYKADGAYDAIKHKIVNKNVHGTADVDVGNGSRPVNNRCSDLRDIIFITKEVFE